jgi:Glycosyl hydrolases family 16
MPILKQFQRSVNLRNGMSLIFLLLARVALSGQPSTVGLAVWLDASDRSSLVVDTNGNISKWSDKSGNGRDATNGASGPAIVTAGLANRDVVRFSGRDELILSGSVRSKPGALTVFMVSRRLTNQVSGVKWQRLVSSSDGVSNDDNHPPNVCFLAQSDGTPAPYSARAEVQEFSDVLPQKMVIGRAVRGPIEFFSGDIAEILIYDRSFLSDDESSAILKYLCDKWDASNARDSRGWTRIGALTDPPKRITDLYPLSDQRDAGNWVKIEELSDEFEGSSLDAAKWQPEYPGFKGRKPSRFVPENVSVSEGKLHLVMRLDPSPDPSDTNRPPTRRYTSAIVESTHLAGYGYYEVMARAMNSAGSSAFWFHRSGLAQRQNEIDVFEIAGKSPGFDRKLNMNLHVWVTPEENRHWDIGDSWLAPWRFADAFHVFGLEWDEKEIKYYVDGVIVRRVNNTNWHDPLHLHFDSETMPTWFGLPADEDLPSTFSVEYVRAWRHASAQ